MPCGLLVNNTHPAVGAADRHGFFACGKYAAAVCHMTGLGMRADGHVPTGQQFIAQGKRSYTLVKPPHPITPRPARAKVNITHSVSVLLPLQSASSTAHYTQGVASLALGYELLPLRDVPV